MQKAYLDFFRRWIIQNGHPTSVGEQFSNNNFDMREEILCFINSSFDRTKKIIISENFFNVSLFVYLI